VPDISFFTARDLSPIFHHTNRKEEKEDDERRERR